MLKNYTSAVTAGRSIAWIEEKLAAHKATKIMKEYTPDGKVASITFAINLNGQELPFKLPARIKECEKILRESVRRPRKDTLKRIDEQAERTAWKIIADWIDAQMAMIDLSQVDFTEVFLPYVFNPVTHKTLYEQFKDNGFKRLLPAAEDRR
jgi:hypothetical protein